MSILNSIELRNAWWLLLAAQPIIIVAISFLFYRIRSNNFSDKALYPWVLVRFRHSGFLGYIRFGIFNLAILMFAIALSGPRIAERHIDSDTDRFHEVQVVFDLSYSMNARDIRPNRIERGKLELFDLVSRMNNIQMGIIVFAARPHIMTPPTADKSVLRHYISMLETQSLPTEGSNLYSALNFAARQFKRKNAAKTILLISDGETSKLPDDYTDDVKNLLIRLRNNSIRIYALGTGSRQGSPLFRDGEWLRNDGKPVISQLQETSLITLAQGSNGKYSHVTDNDDDWAHLYDNGIRQHTLTQSQRSDSTIIVWRELASWFILPGFILILLSHLRLNYRTSGIANTIIPICVVFCGLVFSVPVFANQASYDTAYNAYKKGNLQSAQKLFSQLDGFRARMGEAASAYGQRQYDQAIATYVQALLLANTDSERSQALFNLGNSYYQKKSYRQAESIYRDVLRYDPQHNAAKINLEYAIALQQDTGTNPPFIAKREGTGVRTAPVLDNVDISRGRLTLSDDDADNQPILPDFSEETPAIVPDIQLQQARPASENIVENKDPQWTYTITDIKSITDRLIHFPNSESSIWKRMYEKEEEFVAPRERPEIIPGVRPW